MYLFALDSRLRYFLLEEARCILLPLRSFSADDPARPLRASCRGGRVLLRFFAGLLCCLTAGGFY